jgi:hypothetical protein
LLLQFVSENKKGKSFYNAMYRTLSALIKKLVLPLGVLATEHFGIVTVLYCTHCRRQLKREKENVLSCTARFSGGSTLATPVIFTLG